MHFFLGIDTGETIMFYTTPVSFYDTYEKIIYLFVIPKKRCLEDTINLLGDCDGFKTCLQIPWHSSI